MLFRVCVFLGTLWAIEASGDLDPPSYLAGHVTGDTSVKLAWKVKSPSKGDVFELRWKIKSNESSMVLPGSTGTVTLKNLRVYTRYLFRIRRGLANGTWGAFTKYTSVWTPEGVPTAPPANVAAYNTSSANIMVFWSRVPKPHQNGHVLGYKVCYKRADTNDSVLYCIVVYVLGIELGGLKSYTPYWITVLGYTNKGEGPTSKPLRVWTDEFVPSAAPKVLSLTSNVTAVKVTWDPIPQGHVNGILRGYYVIYWQHPRTSPDNHVIQVNQSTLSVVITGLKRNTSYGVRLAGLTRVRGWIRSGAPSRTHNITTKYGLRAPQNVKAFSPCSSCLRVSWDPVYVPITETAVTGYRVTYRDASGKLYTKFVRPRKSTANLKNLQKFSTYTVTVSAVTDEGLGEISEPVTVTTLEDVPSRAPDSLQVRSTGPRSILVKWSPVPEKYEHGILRGYHVYYRTGKSKMKRSASQVGVIKVMSVNTSSQSLEITGLEPFTHYDVWVSAFTDLGSGPSSRTVTVTTDEDVPSRPPKILKLSAKTSDSVFVQWQPIPQRQVKGILQGYHVHYSEENTSYPVIKNVITVNASVTHATLSAMKPLTRYRVWIAGFTDKGAGPSSEKEFVSTPQAVPNSPQRVQVFIKTPRSVVITWRSHSGFKGSVTRYTVKWLQAGNPADSKADGHKIVNAGSPYRRETQVGGLKPFNMYSFTVREEVGQDNWSKFSDPVDVIMPEDAPSPPREISVKSKEETRLILHWRKPEETNGIIKKYVLHLSNTDGVVKTYTAHFNVNKEYVTYEVSLPDSEAEYKIKVQAYNSLPGLMSEEITVQDLASINTSEVPKSPQDVQVFIQTPNSVRITWRSHSGLTGRVTRYTVKWLHVVYPDDSNVDGHKIVNAGSPYRRDTQVGGLKPFNKYSFMVREEVGQDNWSKFSDPVDIKMPEDVPSPPREISVKSKEGTRLILQWRRPKEPNGVIKKYVLYFNDTDGVIKTHTTHFNVDKEYLTYEVSLPDSESEYKIKVQAYNSLPGLMSEEITVQHLPSIDTSEARKPGPAKPKSKLIWIVGGLVGAILLLVLITAFVLIRRDSKRSKGPIHKLSIISTSAPPSRLIPVKELANHCVRYHANDNALFNDEYKCLERLTWKSSWEASHTGHNRSKNRYCNIVAYDHSRVKLRSVRNIPGSDYINANYVDGYSDPAKYIATQGPLKHTMDDFWRMIWEKNVKTIVMIAMQGKENEPTCEKYWHETEPTKYGHVTVSLLNSCVMTNWTVREFIIWSTDPDSTEKRDIFQYHFTSWPDHYVPRDTAAFLMFHHKLRSALAVDPGPIVVHCSAGVGRTGSFIAIDSLMEQMEAEKAVDVYGFVARMRKQRNYMVQTQEQYWFIHDVLRDASICGVTTIQSDDLGSGLLCVSENEPEIVEKRTTEFENLQVYPSDSPFFSDALARENVVKNRCPERLPFDENRVRLKMIPDEPGSDYINASFIDSYNEGRLYIATQAPIASTVDDFWRMVWEQRSTIVVMLSDIPEDETEHDTRYWPDEGCQWAKYGKLRVTKIDEERLEEHTQRVFKLRCQGTDDSRLLYHFQYRRWGETGLPRAQSLVYLNQLVHKVQSGEEHHGPIIVHCSNGDGRTGVFLSLCLSIERLETEDNVDVFQTVRWLRSQRAGLVTNAEQYNFCYELIKSYLAWRTINTIQDDYI